MIRTHIDELNHRRILRQKYFEDPNHRRLSDITPGGLDSRKYAAWRDDAMFAAFVIGEHKFSYSLSELESYLDKGSELPINWDNLYAYFDEQLADPENPYLSSITTVNTNTYESNIFTSEISLKDLLNRYRDSLTNE